VIARSTARSKGTTILLQLNSTHFDVIAAQRPFLGGEVRVTEMCL
jgi:hypothetical protein